MYLTFSNTARLSKSFFPSIYLLCRAIDLAEIDRVPTSRFNIFAKKWDLLLASDREKRKIDLFSLSDSRERVHVYKIYYTLVLPSRSRLSRPTSATSGISPYRQPSSANKDDLHRDNAAKYAEHPILGLTVVAILGYRSFPSSEVAILSCISLISRFLSHLSLSLFLSTCKF